MGILAYVVFFIPLITGDHKKSPFVKFHANQGLVLWIAFIGYIIISTVLSAIIKVPGSGFFYYVPRTPGWLSAILWLLSIPFIALDIMGLISAINGQMKPLPVIEKISILK